MQPSRRNFIKKYLLTACAPTLITTLVTSKPYASNNDQKIIITDIKVHTVKVNVRGNWIFVELKTNKGISGLGEASQGGGEGGKQIQDEIMTFFSFVKGEAAFDLEKYRQRGWERARTGRISSTAFSAIEHALWDIKGKALGVPVHQLLGGKIRDKVKAYANINRATNERDANGRRPAHAFQQNAELALTNGFRAIKMAPFDEMKALPSTSQQIKADIDHAISCIDAVRRTIGYNIDLLVDVHSHLDRTLGIETAKRVEAFNLFWFEEAVNPGKYPEDTKAITDSTTKTTAGGESIFGREGFAQLISLKALDILMPDVKHCGGILELKYIAAMADTAGLSVAPHNPSGPIATAASVQAVSTIPNFSILEMAYGEVPWRSDLVNPAEQFMDGYITVNDTTGLGYTLNQKELVKHL